MTHGRCFRGEAGGSARAAARAAAALVIAAMFAALWAGPAAAASGARMQSLTAGSAKHAKVKYYIVPQPGHGPPVALYGIAVRTLGNSHRYIEIFNLNKGRLQPNGGRLENPHTIDPGWILQLPADASGPGVHFGRLPGARPSATSPASHRPSRPASGGAAAPGSPVKSTGTNTAVVAGGALAVLLVAGLAFGLSRRRAGAAARRKHSHARSPVPQDSVAAGAAATSPDIHAVDQRWPGAGYSSRSDTGQRLPAAGYPSWPGTADPGRPDPAHSSWPGADHTGGPGVGYPGQPGTGYPNRPGADPRLASADHPSFPGSAPRRPADPRPPADHPSFPGGDHPSFPRAVGGSAGPWRDSSPEPYRDRRSQAAPPAAGLRHPAGYWGPPDPPRQDGPGPAQRRSAQVARTAGPTHQQVALGDGRLQVVLAEAPAVGWPGGTGLGARPEDVLQFAGNGAAQAAQLTDTVRREAGELRNTHSLWLAGRILSGAENQAAEIRQEAYEHAVTLREAAEREAAAAKQQAAAMRAAAEAEAAELLTTARTMSSELGRVAAYVTENLTSPGQPITKPAVRPAAKPAALPVAKPPADPAAEPGASPGRPASKPAARPATKPTARPGAKPSARPNAKPADRPVTKPNGRQVKAIRKMVIALVAVFLVGAISGATEIGLHGYEFFVFRANGAGASLTGPKEDQGPGQPDAPGAHHKAKVGGPQGKPSGNPSSKPSASN